MAGIVEVVRFRQGVFRTKVQRRGSVPRWGSKQGCSGEGARGSGAPLNMSERDRRSSKC